MNHFFGDEFFMTIEQVKEEAKKRFDRELTDEQAQEWLNAHTAGELQDNELDSVAGGCETVEFKCPECGSFKIDHFQTMGSLYSCTCKDCGHEWLC